MRLAPLAAALALALAAAPASALPQKSSPARPPGSVPAASDPRQAALDEIAVWRGFLPDTTPANPLTTEFKPRLDAIEAAFQAAAADAAALARSRTDFERWQHDFIARSCALQSTDCTTKQQLHDFSAVQRATIRDFARQRAAIMDPKLRQAQNAAGPGAQVFYDNDTHTSGTVMLPGSFGSTPPVAQTNAAAQTPHLHIAETPLPPPAAKPFSFASLVSHFDYSGISAKVIRAVETIKNEVARHGGKLLTGFAGSCYYGAKWLMIKAGMLPPEVKLPEEIDRIGIGSGRAYMMSAALKSNTKLQAKLHVRPLKLADIKDSDVKRIPEKTVFVFDRGCAGMSGKSGHIELKLDDDKMADLPASAFYSAGRRGWKSKPTIAADEVMACSDGCMLHTASYLRFYGRRGCLNAYAPVVDRPQPPPAARAPGL